MFRSRSIQSSLSFKDKILSLDYILILSIFILGLVSIMAMYSTDGGELKYHTKSHILAFSKLSNLFSLFYFTFRRQVLWLNVIRFKTVVRSLFYEFTALGNNESWINIIFGKILSSNFN